MDKDNLIADYEIDSEKSNVGKTEDIFDWLFSKMTNYLVTVSGVVTVSGTNFVMNNYLESQP